MKPRIRYKIEAHGHRYSLTKPAPDGDSGVVYSGGGRLDADLRQGLPYEHRLLEEWWGLELHGLAVDVGAHVGNHTLWLAKVCGLSVEAFEPDEEAYYWLYENVESNFLQGSVRAHCAGLGSYNSHGVWDSGTPGVLHPSDAGMADMRTLDSYHLDRVALIKIDVEGYELNVLQGAAATLKQWHPLVYAEAMQTEQQEAITAYLEQFGYRMDGLVRVASPLGRWV